MTNSKPFEKKYRLLKPTPELKIGDEFIYTMSSGSYAYFKDGNPNSKHWFFVENVENNSEWFELIPESKPLSSNLSDGKDWEIVTLKNKKFQSLASYDKAEIGTYPEPLKNIYETREHWISCFLNNKEWVIYSVKRISDNVVFSVGDVVNVSFDDGKGFQDTIHHFTFTSGVNIIDVYFTNTNTTTAFDIARLNISKLPTNPIPDGKEIDFLSTIPKPKTDTVVGQSTINFDKQVLNPHPTGTRSYTNWEQGFLVAANKYAKPKTDTVAQDKGCDATGLFTKEQHEYVNSVANVDLRSHLLHQVRLRDNMSADRDSFEKQLNEAKIKHREEVDTMMEEYGKKCFNAAKAKDTSRAEYFKEIKYSNGMIDTIYPDRYITFQDYLKSLPENSLQPSPVQPQDKPVIWFVNQYWELHSKVKDTHHPADNDKNITVKDKEAGEKYILENKPCLSLNEIRKSFVDVGYGENIEGMKSFQKMTQLVNQKLKQ